MLGFQPSSFVPISWFLSGTDFGEVSILFSGEGFIFLMPVEPYRVFINSRTRRIYAVEMNFRAIV